MTTTLGTGRAKIVVYLAAELKEWLDGKLKQGQRPTEIVARMIADYRESEGHGYRPYSMNWRLELARAEGRIRDLLGEWLNHATMLRENYQAGPADQIELMVMEAQARLLAPYKGPEPLTAQMLIAIARTMTEDETSVEYLRAVAEMLAAATGLPEDVCRNMLNR
jgi:hypothetical protein